MADNSDPRDDIIRQQNESRSATAETLLLIGKDLKASATKTRDNLKKMPGVLAKGMAFRFVSSLKLSPLELGVLAGGKYIAGKIKQARQNVKQRQQETSDSPPPAPESSPNEERTRTSTRRRTPSSQLNDNEPKSEDIADSLLGDDDGDGDFGDYGMILQEISDKLDTLQEIDKRLESSEEIQLETYSVTDKILAALRGDPLQEYENRREMQKQKLLTTGTTAAASTPADSMKAAGGSGILGALTGGGIGALLGRMLPAIIPLLGGAVIPILAAAGLAGAAAFLFPRLKEWLEKSPEETAADAADAVEQARTRAAAAEGTMSEGLALRQLTQAERSQAFVTLNADREGVILPEENRASDELVVSALKEIYDNNMKAVEDFDNEVRSDPTNVRLLDARSNFLTTTIDGIIAEAAKYGGNFERPKSNEELLNEINNSGNEVRNNQNLENLRNFQNIEAAQSREIEANIAEAEQRRKDQNLENLRNFQNIEAVQSREIETNIVEQRRKETQNINERLQQESQGLTAERYELTQREMGEAPIKPEEIMPRPGQSLQDFQMEQYGAQHRYERAAAAHSMHNLPTVERVDTPPSTPAPAVEIPPQPQQMTIAEFEEKTNLETGEGLSHVEILDFYRNNPDYLVASIDRFRESKGHNNSVIGHVGEYLRTQLKITGQMLPGSMNPRRFEGLVHSYYVNATARDTDVQTPADAVSIPPDETVSPPTPAPPPAAAPTVTAPTASPAAVVTPPAGAASTVTVPTPEPEVAASPPTVEIPPQSRGQMTVAEFEQMSQSDRGIPSVTALNFFEQNPEYLIEKVQEYRRSKGYANDSLEGHIRGYLRQNINLSDRSSGSQRRFPGSVIGIYMSQPPTNTEEIESSQSDLQNINRVLFESQQFRSQYNVTPSHEDQLRERSLAMDAMKLGSQIRRMERDPHYSPAANERLGPSFQYQSPDTESLDFLDFSMEDSQSNRMQLPNILDNILQQQEMGMSESVSSAGAAPANGIVNNNNTTVVNRNTSQTIAQPSPRSWLNAVAFKDIYFS